MSILSHLLKKANEVEMKRLLLDVLPERYKLTVQENERGVWIERDELLPRIEKTFHSALKVASPEIKKAVAERIATRRSLGQHRNS